MYNHGKLYPIPFKRWGLSPLHVWQLLEGTLALSVRWATLVAITYPCTTWKATIVAWLV